MKFDFSSYPINKTAYSEKPMSFLDVGHSTALGAIVELALIETGNRTARERWQKTQLRNLLTYVMQRSSFWRSRLGTRRADSKLSALPILTRMDVRQQVAQEGSLLRPTDALQGTAHSTSGTSGVPVQFFTSQMNAQYNGMRYLAQSFIEGKDLSVNRTRITNATVGAAKKIASIPSGFSVEKHPSWLGELGSVFATGIFKRIHCLNPVARDLVRELRKDAVGQLVANPRLLSAIVSHSSAKLLRELRVTEWIAPGEAIDPLLFQQVTEQGIPILSNYTAEEVGPIAFECGSTPGHYHVTTSNVIVEISDELHTIEGKKLGRVLITHLHSYATPFIRYDLGDLASLEERCPCGHDGPTIHSLYGRVTNALKHRDGTLSAFFIRGPELLEILPFTEFRIRQVRLDAIVVEIGGRTELSPEEVANLVAFLKARAGDEFEIGVVPSATIDWGDSVKRQSFRCEV